MKLLQFLIFTVSVTAALAGRAQVAGDAANLIDEGAFLPGGSVGVQGWDLGGFAGGDHGNSLHLTEDTDGNFVTLSITRADRAHFTVRLLQPVSLHPAWTNLHASVDIRVRNWVPSAEPWQKPVMHLEFKDRAGTKVGEANVGLAAYTGTWQRASRNVTVPRGASEVHLWIGSFGGYGGLDFRAPSVVPQRTAGP